MLLLTNRGAAGQPPGKDIMYLTEHYTNIIDIFENKVIGSLNILCLHIHDELSSYPVWIDDEEGAFTSNRDKVIYVLKHFELTSNLTPQETYACPGAVAATSKTLTLIDNVNQAKDAFKDAVLLYLKDCNNKPLKPVRKILADIGYKGLKIRQIYRHIRYVPFQPRRIAWTKAKNGSNIIINKTQARDMLVKAGKGEHIYIQLAKLNLLKQRDKLVIHHDIKPYYAVNIATFKDKNGGSCTNKIHTSLPLFFLYKPILPTPQVCFSAKTCRIKTSPRIDKRIEDAPFLNSINAYRYKHDIQKIY